MGFMASFSDAVLVHHLDQIVEMCVHMCCAGCEKKIRKAIEKLEGRATVSLMHSDFRYIRVKM
jgi:copper chaperone CopZ